MFRCPRKPVSAQQGLRLPRALLIAFPIYALTAGAVRSSETWLQPWPPCVACNPTGELDIDQIFSSDALWPRGLARLNTFVLTPFHINRLSDRDLAGAAAWLRQHHIAADLDIQSIPFDPSCGTGIEGFGDLGGAMQIVRRLQDAGLSPEYLTMDEPLWGAHYLGGPTACAYPIEKLAKRVAEMLRIYHRAFPNMKVGDTEPFSALMSMDGWSEGLRQFVDDIRVQSGIQIQFLNVDSSWNANWRAALPRFLDELQTLGLQVGVIYDAAAGTDTSRSAVELIVDEFKQLEDGLGAKVDKAIFGGWYRFPDHLLPEGDPAALVHAITRYNTPRTKVSIKRSLSAVEGVVTFDTGDPVPGAIVEVRQTFGKRTDYPFVAAIQGKVPAWASFALVGIRVNSEMSPEDFGDVDLSIRRIAYRETQPIKSEVEFKFSQGLRSWQSWESGYGPLTVSTDLSNASIQINSSHFHGFSFNGPFFPVRGNATFEAQIVESLTLPTFGSAYGIIVFFDNSLSKTDRAPIKFDYRAEVISSTVSDGWGNFSIPCSVVRNRPRGEFEISATLGDYRAISTALAGACPRSGSIQR